MDVGPVEKIIERERRKSEIILNGHLVEGYTLDKLWELILKLEPYAKLIEDLSKTIQEALVRIDIIEDECEKVSFNFVLSLVDHK